jgi:hypothetical protein
VQKRSFHYQFHCRFAGPMNHLLLRHCLHRFLLQLACRRIVPAQCLSPKILLPPWRRGPWNRLPLSHRFHSQFWSHYRTKTKWEK